MRNSNILLTMLAVLAASALRAAAEDEAPAAAPPLAQPAVRGLVSANDDSNGPLPEPAATPDQGVRPLPPLPASRLPETSPAPRAPEPVPAPIPATSTAPLPPATGIASAASEAPASSYPSNGAMPCPQRCCRNGWCGHHECDFSERPFGACVRSAVCAQICTGLQARMVLYQYDFCDPTACDGYKLSVKGVTRLAELARMLPASNFHPITIEASFQNPQLDARRRDYVLQTLGLLNVPVPDQLVVVGKPDAPGLNGQEALILNRNLDRDVRAGGSQLPTTNATYNSANGGTGTGGMGTTSGGQAQ
jgi:hypothetical protein